LTRSELFDETHTPRFEEKEKIPDTLFNVAAMDYRVNQNDTMACFTLESLDSMRCVYPEETVLNFNLLRKIRRYRKGEIGRSVPGWQIGYPVFDRLLCMYAFYSKYKPVRVRITRSTGFEFIHTGNHTFECLKASDVHRLAVSVFFVSPSHHDRGGDIDRPDVLEPDEEPGQVEVLLDQEFPWGHLHPSERIASLQKVADTPLNPLWWSLAETKYNSNLTSTCGCH